MKLAQTKVKLVADASVAAVEAAVNTFLQSGGERQLVSLVPVATNTAVPAVLIHYTEG